MKNYIYKRIMRNKTENEKSPRRFMSAEKNIN